MRWGIRIILFAIAGACLGCGDASAERFAGLPSHVFAEADTGNLEPGTELWIAGDLAFDQSYFLVDPEQPSVRLPVEFENEEQRACLGEAAGQPVRIVGNLGREIEMSGVISVWLLLDSGEDHMVCYFY